jgi:bifunctional enzyme CysN/CysC
MPSAGKSTLARAARAQLGPRAVLLDEDQLRGALAPSRRRTEGDSFEAMLTRLASRVARQGRIALVAATSPRRQHRLAAREAAPRFVEVHVATPREVFAGRIHNGHYTTYETPPLPDVIARGGHDRLALERILELVGGRALGSPASAGRSC